MSNCDINFVLFLELLASVSATCPILIYLITNARLILILFPILIAFSDISGNIFGTITMEMFPTAFR